MTTIDEAKYVLQGHEAINPYCHCQVCRKGIPCTEAIVTEALDMRGIR